MTLPAADIAPPTPLDADAAAERADTCGMPLRARL